MKKFLKKNVEKTERIEEDEP